MRRMARMDRVEALRGFFETPIRYFWLTLLIPSLISLKFAFGVFSFWPDYPLAWILHFVPFACMVVPLQLTYDHLPQRMQPSDLTALRAVPFHILVAAVWGAFGLVIGTILVSPLFPPADADFSREWREIPFLVFIATVVGAPVVVRGISYRDTLEESRNRALRAQREALAAQVQALQARIEPHFLFNSLNAAASLISHSPERAERALEKIADLFRYALEASNAPLVPLGRELESVEGFLELEKLRFPDHLDVSLRVEPGVADVPVPPLSLQPLVENAVRHGIAQREERGRLEVEIGRGPEALRVRVEDDGPGPGSSSHRGAGSALADLRKRLSLLYGEAASLDVDRGPLGGCRVTLCLPVDGGGAPAREEAS